MNLPPIPGRNDFYFTGILENEGRREYFFPFVKN